MGGGEVELPEVVLLVSCSGANLSWLRFSFRMLTGKALIALVKDNPDLNRSQLARKAGYMTELKNGKVKPNVQGFYDALLEAQGLSIKNGQPGIGAGKAAQYLTTVHKSGVLLVGKVYTNEFGAEPGDVFGIEVRDDGIWLPLKERDVELRKQTVGVACPAPGSEEEEEEEEEELVAA